MSSLLWVVPPSDASLVGRPEILMLDGEVGLFEVAPLRIDVMPRLAEEGQVSVSVTRDGASWSTTVPADVTVARELGDDLLLIARVWSIDGEDDLREVREVGQARRDALPTTRRLQRRAVEAWLGN